MSGRKTATLADALILLRSRRSGDRAHAVDLIGRKGEVGALPAILDRLHDRAGEVRMRALEALERFPDVPLAHFMTALSDKDRLVRIQAAEALATRSDPRAVRHLRKALSDPDHLVRSYVAAAIGSLGTPADRRMLRRHLSSETSDVARLGLLEGLWLLKDRTVFDQALALLDSNDYRVRCATAAAMAATFLSETTRGRIRGALKARLVREKVLSVREALDRAVSAVSRSR